MSSYDYLKTVGEKIAETKIKDGNQNKRIFVMGHMPLFLDKHKKEKVPKEPKEPKAPIEPEESIELDIEEASESIKPSKKEKESKGKGEDITKLKKGTLGEDKSPILIDSLYEILAEHKCIYLCADCHNFNIMSIKNGDDKCVIQITSGTGGADPDIIKDLNEKKVVDISGYNITYYSINSYGYCKILVEKSGIVVSYNKIIAADCNNKSIDELDKVSNTYKGQEIINTLIHITDPVQNDKFNDRYFEEIDFDISRSMIIFTYNDDSLINPILRDRMIVINVSGYDNDEKIVLASGYIIPEILKQYNFNNGDIIFSNELLRHIINNIEKEDGVRNLKRAINNIVSWINMMIYVPTDLIKISIPYTVSHTFYDTYCKKYSNNTSISAKHNSIYL